MNWLDIFWGLSTSIFLLCSYFKVIKIYFSYFQRQKATTTTFLWPIEPNIFSIKSFPGITLIYIFSKLYDSSNKEYYQFLHHTRTLLVFNRSWHISTTPNTTKFFLFVFKLIKQSSIMVILSCLVKKNQNLNLRKKSSV